MARADEAAMAAAKGKSAMPQRGAGSTKGAAPWHKQTSQKLRNPYPFAPHGSVATGAASAAAEPQDEEPPIDEEPEPDEDETPRDDEEIDLYREELPPSKMTQMEWEELDYRALRAPTPDLYEVFPKDEQAAQINSLKELVVGPKDGPSNCVLWCFATKHVSVNDMKDAYNNFAILARM